MADTSPTLFFFPSQSHLGVLTDLAVFHSGSNFDTNKKYVYYMGSSKYGEFNIFDSSDI